MGDDHRGAPTPQHPFSVTAPFLRSQSYSEHLLHDQNTDFMITDLLFQDLCTRIDGADPANERLGFKIGRVCISAARVGFWSRKVVGAAIRYWLHLI